MIMMYSAASTQPQRFLTESSAMQAVQSDQQYGKAETSFFWNLLWWSF